MLCNRRVSENKWKRHVGGIRIIRHVVQILPISIAHNKTRVALVNLQCDMCKDRTGNRTSLDLIMGIGSACLWTDQLDT